MKFQLFAIVLLVCIYSSLASKNFKARFSSFKAKFNRQYADKAEEAERFETFMTNCAIIDKLNEDFLNNKSSFNVDINKFADMNDNEIKSHFGLPKVSTRASLLRLSGSGYPRSKYEQNFVASAADISAAPKSVDWTTKWTKLSENQGACGACAFFATAGTLDALYQIQKGKTIDTSEQELYDCVQSAASKQSCGGQHIAYILDRVVETGAVETKNYYSYTSGQTRRGEACRTSAGPRNKISKVLRVEWKNEEAAKVAVSKYGVCLTQVLGDGKGFQYYRSGIYDGAECRGIEINHAIAIVGYGSEGGKDYWKIRNSWGPGWGENGNGRILRNKGNVCGIAADVWCIA
jgi:C1A family cysteine protease